MFTHRGARLWRAGGPGAALSSEIARIREVRAEDEDEVTPAEFIAAAAAAGGRGMYIYTDDGANFSLHGETFNFYQRGADPEALLAEWARVKASGQAIPRKSAPPPLKVENGLFVRSFHRSRRATHIDPPEGAEADLGGEVSVIFADEQLTECLTSYAEEELREAGDGDCYYVEKWTLDTIEWDEARKEWRAVFSPDSWESHDIEPDHDGDGRDD